MAKHDLTTPGTAPAVTAPPRQKAEGGTEGPATATSAPDLKHGYNATPEAGQQLRLANTPRATVDFPLTPLSRARLERRRQPCLSAEEESEQITWMIWQVICGLREQEQIRAQQDEQNRRAVVHLLRDGGGAA